MKILTGIFTSKKPNSLSRCSLNYKPLGLTSSWNKQQKIFINAPCHHRKVHPRSVHCIRALKLKEWNKGWHEMPLYDQNDQRALDCKLVINTISSAQGVSPLPTRLYQVYCHDIWQLGGWKSTTYNNQSVVTITWLGNCTRLSDSDNCFFVSTNRTLMVALPTTPNWHVRGLQSRANTGEVSMLGAYKGKLMLISTWVDSAWDGKKLMDGQPPH